MDCVCSINPEATKGINNQRNYHLYWWETGPFYSWDRESPFTPQTDRFPLSLQSETGYPFSLLRETQYSLSLLIDTLSTFHSWERHSIPFHYWDTASAFTPERDTVSPFTIEKDTVSPFTIDSNRISIPFLLKYIVQWALIYNF